MKHNYWGPLFPCALFLTVILCGCVGADPSGEPTNTNAPHSPTASMESPLPPSQTEATSYQGAYYGAIKELINAYGFWYDDENGIYQGAGPGGLLGCELIDFDSDDTPELVCIYRDAENHYFNTISLYRYDGDTIDELLTVVAGDELWGDNASSIQFGTLDGKRYIRTANSTWGKTERVYIITVENDMLNVKEFLAEIDATDIAPPEYEYRECFIDSTAVSIENYLERKALYDQNASWFSKDKARLEQFIRGLAEYTGDDEIYLEKLFSTRPVRES